MIQIIALLSFVCAEKLELGVKAEGMIAPWQNDPHYRIYEVTIDTLIPYEDLVIMAKALSPRGDPKIYISYKNTEPITKQLADLEACESKGIDICVVDAKHLEAQKPIYIGVVCEGFCRFQVKAIYEKEHSMTNNDDLEFRLTEKESTEIIKLHLANLTSQDVEITIAVSVKNMRQMEEPLYVFMNYGDQIPKSDNYSVKGIDNWDGTQIISLKENLVNGGLYTMLIECSEGAVVVIKVRTHSEVREMRMYEDMEGVLKKDDYQIYRLNLSQEIEGIQRYQWNLNFQLNPFSGYSYLYVNADTKPALLDNYMWSYKNKIGDDLVITPEELIKQNLTGRVFYIVVYGASDICSYRLRVQSVDKTLMFLELDKPTSGKMERGEQMNYQVTIQGSKPHDVNVRLEKLSGVTDLVVKKCDNETCLITSEEVKNRKSLENLEKNKLFLYSQSKSGTDLISFQFDPQYCTKTSTLLAYCTYSIAVFDNDKPTKNNTNSTLSYQITVTTTASHSLLIENNPHKDFVGKGQSEFYKFKVNEGDTIHRLSFILTPITGEPHMYLSREDKRPTKEVHDREAEQNVIHFGGRTETVGSGSYYLNIYGHTASLYGLTVIVFRDWGDRTQIGKYPWHYVQLHEGDLHKYTSNETQVWLYKIDLGHYSSENFTEPVLVEINAIVGKFELLGFDHPEMDNRKALWNGTKSLYINSSDPNYPQILYFKVIPNVNNTLNQFQLEFLVGEWHIQDLPIGQNYYGLVTKDTPVMFEVPFYEAVDLVITKNSDSGRQSDITVEVMMPGVNEQQLNFSDQQSLRIKKDKLHTNECKATAQQNYFFCYIYITVKVTGEDTFFNLIVTQEDNSPIKLIDSQPVTRAVPTESDHYTFTVQEDFAEIIVYCDSGVLEVMANIGKNSEFPEDKADLVSLTQSWGMASSLYVQAEMLKDCKPDCSVKVTVKKSNSTRAYFDGHYTIVQTSQVMPLAERQHYVGEIPDKGMKYFKINVPYNTGLMIVVTPLSEGDPDVYVKKDALPSVSEYDWSSANYQADQLFIEKDNPIHPNMIGTYYIGVFGFKQTKFSIQIKIGDFHQYQIYPGMPMNVVISKSAVAYFHYVHYEDKPFKVLVSSNSGLPKIFVTNYQNNAELDNIYAQTLPEFKYNNTGYGYFQIARISNTDEQYCKQCTYVIAVLAQNDCDFSVTVAPHGEFIYLKNNQRQDNFVSKGNTQHYHYFAKTDFTFQITLYQGDVSFVGRQNRTIENRAESDIRIDNIKFDKNIVQQTKSVIFNTTLEHIYSFYIETHEDSQYSLICTGAATHKMIQYGTPEHFQLDNRVPTTFQFRSDNKNPNQKISITISNDMRMSQSDREQGLQHPFVEVKRDMLFNSNVDGEHKWEPSVADYEINTEQHHYLEFKDIEGLYWVTLYIKKESNSEYSLIVNNNGMNSLVPGLARIISSPVGAQQNWEVYTGRPEMQLFLNVHLCGGIVAIYADKDSQRITRGVYTEKMEYVHNKQLMGSFIIKDQGPYYIGTKMLKIHHDLPKAAYTIEATLLEKDSFVPSELLEPGDDGELTWSVDKDSILTIQFAQLKLKKQSDEFAVISTVYYLLLENKPYSDETPLNTCNINTYTETVEQPSNPTDKQLTLKRAVIPDIDQKVQFTVYAKTFIGTKNKEQVTLNYFYNPDTFNETHTRTAKIRHYFRYIVGGAVIIGVIVIAYLYRKNKLLQAQLKYELTDVRTQGLVSATAEQTIEMNTNYRGFQDAR